MPKKKNWKENTKSPLGKRLRRKARKYIGPKQTGLKPAFKDGLVFHSQVRVGKRGPKSEAFPKGKPKAIVATKIRTMKRGAHKDYTGSRIIRERYTRLGNLIREKHWDELLQIEKVLTGELNLVGLRVLPKEDYRGLSPKLKEIYDKVGPGLIPIRYACKSRQPSAEEMEAVAEYVF